MSKVFLGGTCNESTWRDKIIPRLKIDYFNPVVDDWTPECQAEEERQKNEVCDIHLYVITPKMTGVFSIAEVTESAISHCGRKCVFCYTEEDETENSPTFTKAQCKSLDAVGRLVSKYGAVWCRTLDEVVEYLNSIKD